MYKTLLQYSDDSVRQVNPHTSQAVRVYINIVVFIQNNLAWINAKKCREKRKGVMSMKCYIM